MNVLCTGFTNQGVCDVEWQWVVSQPMLHILIQIPQIWIGRKIRLHIFWLRTKLDFHKVRKQTTDRSIYKSLPPRQHTHTSTSRPSMHILPVVSMSHSILPTCSKFSPSSFNLSPVFLCFLPPQPLFVLHLVTPTQLHPHPHQLAPPRYTFLL